MGNPGVKTTAKRIVTFIFGLILISGAIMLMLYFGREESTGTVERGVVYAVVGFQLLVGLWKCGSSFIMVQDPAPTAANGGDREQ